MEKKTNILTLLIGAIVMAIACSSCTNDEDIDIQYETTVGITAAHLFDSFTPFENSDFDPQVDGWTLNIDVLYYNHSGLLVNKESFQSNRMDEVFKSSVYLEPGEYKVVAIAHFSKESEDYHYWEISNPYNINDLSIDEVSEIYPTAFETLGLYTGNLTVTDKSTSVDIDIKPATALFEVFEIDKMLSYIGYKGKYSIKCLKVAQYNVRTVSFRDNVRFVEGEPTYNISEQISNYNFAISRPYDKMDENKSPNTRSYRAILPESSKQFSYTIYNGDIPTDYDKIIQSLVGSYPTEGRSASLDIISGHQYSLAFMLDACEFIYEDVTGRKYNIDDAVNEQFNKYQTNKINNMVNFGFQHLIGTSAKEIEHTIGVGIKEIEQRPSGKYVANFFHSPETVFEQYVTASFNDSSCDKAWRIMLTLSLPKSAYGTELGQEMPESIFQEVWEALNKKYYHFRTVGKQTMFLDGPTKAESKVGIILDGTNLDNVNLFFDDISLYL